MLPHFVILCSCEYISQYSSEISLVKKKKKIYIYTLFHLNNNGQINLGPRPGPSLLFLFFMPITLCSNSCLLFSLLFKVLISIYYVSPTCGHRYFSEFLSPKLSKSVFIIPKWFIKLIKGPTTHEISDGQQCRAVHVNLLESSDVGMKDVALWDAPQIDHLVVSDAETPLAASEDFAIVLVP